MRGREEALGTNQRRGVGREGGGGGINLCECERERERERADTGLNRSLVTKRQHH